MDTGIDESPHRASVGRSLEVEVREIRSVLRDELVRLVEVVNPLLERWMCLGNREVAVEEPEDLLKY